jgi:hypothetical protein
MSFLLLFQKFQLRAQHLQGTKQKRRAALFSQSALESWSLIQMKERRRSFSLSVQESSINVRWTLKKTLALSLFNCNVNMQPS